MAITNKAIISKLLKEGTSAGPVTQEMIDWCMIRHKESCKKFGPGVAYGWMDWLAQARKKFKPETRK